MNASSGQRIEGCSHPWNTGQPQLPSYNILLDFRTQEWRLEVSQAERQLYVSRIASGIRLARPGVQESVATQIATTLENYNFGRSKDKEEYQKSFRDRYQQIEAAAACQTAAESQSRESVLGPGQPMGWKKDMTQMERNNFISLIISAVISVQPNIHQSTAATIATTFERNTLNRASGKQEYQHILQKKLQQIQVSIKRREMTYLENQMKGINLEKPSQSQSSDFHNQQSLAQQQCDLQQIHYQQYINQVARQQQRDQEQQKYQQAHPNEL